MFMSVHLVQPLRQGRHATSFKREHIMATRHRNSEPYILCMITYLIYTTTVSTAGAI
jgi:hypothetical protein